jgi:Flp pilus assembly pilin Flp
MSDRPQEADFGRMSLSRWIDRIRSRSSREEEAQTLAEYAVILGVITPVVVLAFIMLGQAIPPVLDRVRGFL